MSGGGLNLPNPEELDAPAEGETAAGTLDPSIAEALGLILGGTQAPAEDTPTARDWLNQTFGGGVVGSGAGEDMPMTGLGAAAGTSLSDVVAQVQGMNQAELSFLQRRLFQAGFYSSTVYGNAVDIDWGSIDTHTVEALQAAFEKAGTNQVTNFDQFLLAESARFRRDGVTADGTDLGSVARGAQSEQSIVDILLEDPDAIKLTAEAVGTELLGRKPTEAELGRITAKIHDEQTRVAKERNRQLGNGMGGANPYAETEALLGGDMAIEGGYTPEPGVKLTAEQYDNARIIMEVGNQMGLSEEYIVGALSAAIVESGLRNINYGDRDSVGLFQQRTSQGWGTIEQILDPRYSARKFYEAMLRASGDTLGERVANTQRPAKEYRGRYAEQMNKAAGILDLMVSFKPTPAQADRPGSSRPVGGRAASSGPANPRQADLGSRLTPGGVSSVGAGASPIPKEPDDQPFWLGTMVGNSQSDPIFNTVMDVDVDASIAEELRRTDPVAYETRQAAVRAYEFFAMLGAGGGLV